MQKRRAGFTLIELLIVIVIIGILAAIAIPKFGKTRERAYVKAMESDLRNLAAQQEIYYSTPTSNYTYGSDIVALDVVPSSGVALVVSGTTTGWVATASHTAVPTLCGLYSGTPPNTGVGVSAGVVHCTP